MSKKKEELKQPPIEVVLPKKTNSRIKEFYTDATVQCVYVKRSTKENLAKLAAKRGVSASKIVNDLIEPYVGDCIEKGEIKDSRDK